MTSRRSFVRPILTTVGCLALLIHSGLGTALADEQHREFLERMRARLYYDTALDYLDEVESRPGLDDAVKAVLIYERAVTLQEFAQTTRDPDERVRLLDRAEKLLADFTTRYPTDERIADANSRRAKILLDKAESEVYRAESPANADQADSLRERARGYIETARKVFETAREQHATRYDSFPKFTEDDVVKEQRTEAEYQMIQARIDLAMCTYMEARTHRDGDAERSRLFARAAEEFRAIRDDHRRQIAGLHAELWEAKCYEEQGELDRAIPLYDRLIDPGENDRNPPSSLIELRDQALRFKLGCWNKKDEYRLVYNAANDDNGWLKTAGRRADGLNGLGIRWELARAEEQLAYAARTEAKRLDDVVVAQEKLSKDRDRQQAERTAATKLAREAREAAKEAREAYERLLQAALNRARGIAQYATHYQEVAVLMSSRIQVELEGDTRAPETFKEGFVQLQLRIGEIQDANAAVERAESEAVRLTKIAEQRELLESIERLAQLTVALGRAAPVATDDQSTEEDGNAVKPADLARAWYLYAYVEYQMSHDFEAAVIGRYLMNSRKTTDPQTARDGAFLAIAAMQHAYHAGKPERTTQEFGLLLEIAEELTGTWSEDKLADSARMLVGDEFARRNEPVRAAEWFTGVSTTSPSHLDAQLKAGQAYYGAYNRAAFLPADERPDSATLDGWRAKALEHLRTGVDKKQDEVPAGATDAQKFELIRGKITLAEILIADAQERAAVDLLTNDPHSVLKAIEIDDGGARPKTGVRSAAFAQSTYTLLLRAYIGLQQTDEALQTMDRLEEVAGGASVDLYRDLGRNLQDEIERLRGLGQTERLAEVRTAFDTFLAKVYEQRQSLGYNSLLWIAETYFGLASGMGDDPAGLKYFDNAADAYTDILDKANADPDFGRDRNLVAVRLKLVRCRAAQGEYEAAYGLALAVLLAQPTAMDAQYATSRVLQQWAESGPPDAVEKFRLAMLGKKVVHEGRPVVVYGFKKIADVYGAALSRGTLSDEEGLATLVDAYYNLVACQRGLAVAEGGTSQREDGLKRAMMLFGGIRNLGGSLTDEQKQRFQDQYHAVQGDLGQPLTEIGWPENVESTPVVAARPTPAPPATAPTKVAGTPEGPENTPSSSGGLMMPLLLLLLAAGAAAGFYVLMAKPKRRRPLLAAGGEPEPTFASAPSEQPSRRRRPAGTSGGEASSSSSGRRPAEGEATPRRKKRPRPPE